MDEEIKKRFELIEQRLAVIEEKFNSDVPIPIKKQSINEYLLSKKPNGAVEKTLVIGGFLESRGAKYFTVAELKKGFSEAKEPLPGNISDMVYKNVKKGNMTKSIEAEDAYTLTNKGIADLGLMEKKND